MPAQAALKQPAARRPHAPRRPKSAGALVTITNKLPADWLALYSSRAREVVGQCIDAMRARLADPDALRDIPLRDLAQAAQRTQMTAALLSGEAWQRSGHPVATRAPDDAADYLDSVSTVKGSSKRVDSVCDVSVSRAREGQNGADPAPSSEPETPADAPESVELT
jgi:hypothetical protein